MLRAHRRGAATDAVLVAAHESLVRAYEQPDQLAATVGELGSVREDAVGLLALADRAPLPAVPVDLVVATLVAPGPATGCAGPGCG